MEKYINNHTVLNPGPHKTTGSVIEGECVICLAKDNIKVKASNLFPFSVFKNSFYFCNKHTNEVKSLNDKEGVLDKWYKLYIEK